MLNYRSEAFFAFRFRHNFSFQKLWDVDQNGKQHDWKGVKDYSSCDSVRMRKVSMDEWIADCNVPKMF